jgi:hypothetical protein
MPSPPKMWVRTIKEMFSQKIGGRAGASVPAGVRSMSMGEFYPICTFRRLKIRLYFLNNFEFASPPDST